MSLCTVRPCTCVGAPPYTTCVPYCTALFHFGFYFCLLATVQEASEIGPSPGLNLEASTPASDSSSPPMGLDAQAMTSRQQQQQQPKQGGGRDDGSRSTRGGPGAVAAAERQALTPGEGLLESMDVFSLGCVIAEVCRWLVGFYR